MPLAAFGGKINGKKKNWRIATACNTITHAHQHKGTLSSLIRVFHNPPSRACRRDPKWGPKDRQDHPVESNQKKMKKK